MTTQKSAISSSTNTQPNVTPRTVAPPTSYATYPGAFYIDPETKKTVRAVTNRIHESKGHVAKSSIHGYGVFASANIEAGSIIEECLAIILDTTTKHNKDWVITDYMFTWPCDLDDPICKAHGSTFFVPSGNALIYNHSDTPNVYWIYDRQMKRIFLSALRDIKENEELTWYYGHGYAHKLRNGNNPSNASGCNSCQQKKKELEEKQRLQEVDTNISTDPVGFSSPPMDERKKELLNKWLEQKKKESL